MVIQIFYLHGLNSTSISKKQHLSYFKRTFFNLYFLLYMTPSWEEFKIYGINIFQRNEKLRNQKQNSYSHWPFSEI